MDKKCIQLVSELHQKIMQNIFTEVDIFCLLVLVREYAPQNTDYEQTEWEHGYLREICDFIAHRNRDRGFVFENAKYAYKHSTTAKVEYKDNTCDVFHDIDTRRQALCGMSEDTIISELNNVFDTIGLSHVAKHTEPEIILCIISLLQLTTFKTKDGKANGYIYVHIEQDGIYMINYVHEAMNPLHLRVEDERYHNLVETPMTLVDDIFKLERKGETLTVILPK